MYANGDIDGNSHAFVWKRLTIVKEVLGASFLPIGLGGCMEVVSEVLVGY